MNEAQYRWSLENGRPARRARALLSSEGESGMLRRITRNSRAFQQAVEAWNDAVYAPLKRVARPAALARGVLVIEAADGAAAERVRREAAKLLGLLRAALPNLARLQVRTRAELEGAGADLEKLIGGDEQN